MNPSDAYLTVERYTVACERSSAELQRLLCGVFWLLLRIEQSMRHTDSCARLYYRSVVKKRARVRYQHKYISGKAKNNPRAGVGLPSANSIQRA